MGTVEPFQNSSQELRLALWVSIAQDGLCTKYLKNAEMEDKSLKNWNEWKLKDTLMMTKKALTFYY